MGEYGYSRLLCILKHPPTIKWKQYCCASWMLWFSLNYRQGWEEVKMWGYQSSCWIIQNVDLGVEAALQEEVCTIKGLSDCGETYLLGVSECYSLFYMQWTIGSFEWCWPLRSTICLHSPHQSSAWYISPVIQPPPFTHRWKSKAPPTVDKRYHSGIWRWCSSSGVFGDPLVRLHIHSIPLHDHSIVLSMKTIIITQNLHYIP